MHAQAPTFDLAPFSYAEAVALSSELGVSLPVAAILARRGLADPEDARRFLAAAERHPASELDGVADAAEAIHEAIAARRPITVHGDYDVDGVCATALTVAALRELGAECDWLIPDRLGEGYGMSRASVEEIARRGSGLIVTVDCGITAVDEVEYARSLGLDVVITDHHRPAGELPGCPIVHPAVGSYPFAGLCGAAVAHKLVEVLCGPERADTDLDLVALATIADMVELRDENRRLVRAGLELIRRRPRPGIAALARAAGCVVERLDEADVGFRLGPRINAAGRLYRADAGVELMLTADAARAAEIAAELQRANHERRDTEAAVLAGAERAWAELLAERPDRAAIVVAGEGWHPGVVGICASRMAERHRRPAVLIALDGTRGRGSGRSVPGFDLLAGLTESARHLDRFGGHGAAAGLELAADAVAAFRADFERIAAAALPDGPSEPAEPVDVVVGCGELTTALAEELELLAPFGRGNAEPRLLVPGVRIEDVRAMGEGDRHSRFSLASGGARTSGVAFRDDGALAAAGEGPHDVSVRLELNEWNGTTSPRVVLGRRVRSGAGGGALVADLVPPPPEPDEFAERATAALWAGAGMPPSDPEPGEPHGAERRRTSATPDPGGAIALIAGLASSDRPALIVCADAMRRLDLIARAVPPAAFGGGAAAVLAARLSLRSGLARARAVPERGRGLVLADWPALRIAPELAAGFEHVVIVDPPWDPRDRDLLRLGRHEPGSGFTHDLSELGGTELALAALDSELPDRELLATVYVRLRGAAGPDGLVARDPAVVALAGGAAVPRAPEVAGRCLRVLTEIGAVSLEAATGGDWLRVVSSGVKDLSNSAAFAGYRASAQEGRRFLTEARQAIAA